VRKDKLIRKKIAGFWVFPGLKGLFKAKAGRDYILKEK